MVGCHKVVEWTDGTCGTIDLDDCAGYSERSSDPTAPRLYKTPDGRWFANVGNYYMGMTTRQAGTMLLRMGYQHLPEPLIRALHDEDQPDGRPHERLLIPANAWTGPAVVLSGPSKSPLVLGQTVPLLTTVQYEVVDPLNEAGERGLSLNELRSFSKHDDVRGVLNRVKKTHPLWIQVIHMAGCPWGRYRISVPA
jgi:hypothetical protein